MKDEYIRDNKESLGSLGHIGAEYVGGSPLFPFSAVEAQADGRGEDEADRREEGRHRARVFSAIGEYLTKKKRK